MLSIGELSKQTGASVRSLRHYEQSGLLAASRFANGYRYFDPAAVQFVQRIRVLLNNGFTLEEMRPVASMLDPNPRSMRAVCADVIALYGSKLDELDRRIADLQQVRNSAAARLAFIEEQRRQGGPDEPAGR
ncbi:MAG: MerR family transcriptional regulator [Telluria sp.]